MSMATSEPHFPAAAGPTRRDFLYVSTAAVAGQLMKPDATQAREIVELSRRVQGRETTTRQVDIEPGEFRFPGLNELPRRRSL